MKIGSLRFLAAEVKIEIGTRMTTYEIIDWRLSQNAVAAERLQRLLNIGEVNGFCIEAHFKNVRAMQRLAETMPTDRYALYCWVKELDSADILREEFKKIGKAEISYGHRGIEIYPDLLLPHGDGVFSNPHTLILAYSERRIQIETSQDREVRIASVSERLQAVLSRIMGGDVEKITPSISWKDGLCDYAYSIEIDCSLVQNVANALASELRLEGGVGSFELLGTAEEIAKMAKNPKLLLGAFPPSLPSFNANVGGTSFAAGRSSFQFPIIGATSDKLPLIAESMDRIEDIELSRFLARYVGWQLGNKRGPRLAGNFIMISNKSNPVIYLGFDQYSPKDPAISEYVDALGPIVGDMGGRFKKVPHFE
jgi:hypothetical protein